MADQVVAVQAQGGGEGGDIVRAGLGAVVQFRTAGRQAASADIQHIGVEVPAEAFGNEAPGDRRAGDTGDQDQRRALAAIAQVVLANAVGLDVAAVDESAHAATPDFSTWA